MKKLLTPFFLAVILLLSLISPALTLEEQDGFLQGTLLSRDGIQIKVIMPVPQAPPEIVNQTKLQQLKLGRVRTLELIEQYGQSGMKATGNEKWRIDVDKADSEFAISYQEENAKYGYAYTDFTDTHWPLDTANAAFVQADATVKSFLDGLGLAYEYPFHAVLYDYQKTIGSSRLPISQEDYLASRYEGREEKLLARWAVTDGPPIIVIVRFTLDGIPFGTNISWTKGSNTAGNGNATPSAFFTVLANGKIGAVVIRNPFEVAKSQPDKQAILSWETVLNNAIDYIAEIYCTGNKLGDSLILTHAEFQLYTDANNIAFPAWSFFFERTFADSGQMHVLCLSYDAHTGAPIW